MRKRWFLVGMMFLLLPWLLAGCGVAQEQYDAIVSDLNKAQQEVQSLTAELDKTQAKVAELMASLDECEAELKAEQAKSSELASNLGKTETELEGTKVKNSELTSSLQKSQSELSAAKSEYTAFKSDAKSSWERFDKIVGLEWFIVGYWSAGARQDAELIEQRTARMVSYVEPVGDSMLTSLWQQAMDAAGKGQDTLFLESFAAVMDRNSKLLSDQAKVIRSELAK